MSRKKTVCKGIFLFGLLGPFFVLVSPAPADIYMYVDGRGVIHFSNVPTSSEYRIYIKEKRPPPAADSSSARYDHLINEAAEKHGIAAPLIKAMIKAESDFNPRAVSKKGAMGLMQIMPQNLKRLNIKNPFNPRENIMGGARYFKRLYHRYNERLTLSLAAYNAGPTVVDRYLAVPPIKETKAYVKKVLEYYRRYKNL